MHDIYLATEDILSETVGLRLIKDFLPSFSVGDLPTFGKKGNGFLKSKIEAYCNISKRIPFLLITDLDSAQCAPSLISSWLKSRVPPPNFIFRVAEQEIEGWLLADDVAIETLLGSNTKIRCDLDNVANPKEFLLTLAQKAPRAVRADLLPERGAVASRGLNYNRRLCDYVNNQWSPARAAVNSKSLARAIRRLEEFEARFQIDQTPSNLQ